MRGGAVFLLDKNLVCLPCSVFILGTSTLCFRPRLVERTLGEVTFRPPGFNWVGPVASKTDRSDSRAVMEGSGCRNKYQLFEYHNSKKLVETNINFF